MHKDFLRPNIVHFFVLRDLIGRNIFSRLLYTSLKLSFERMYLTQSTGDGCLFYSRIETIFAISTYKYKSRDITYKCQKEPNALLGSKIFSMKAIYINCVVLLLDVGRTKTTSSCKDGNTQTGTTVCGLNGSGFLDQTCTEGQWVDSETCDDPDVCISNDATQSGTTVCGLNGSGFLDQICTEGQWADSDTCDDLMCAQMNSTQSGTTVCGLNGSGFLDQTLYGRSMD